jgi:hypothetical protein
VIGFIKADGISVATHHRVTVIVLFGVLLAASVLRGRAVAMAVFAAALLGATLAHHSVGLGIAIGVGALFALLVAFAAIGTAIDAGYARRGHRRAD